ncbi:WD40 repeat-like protein [Gigaspora margarita]|uniref:WD40 repeat-like protein n=1 Tax=Gigaspora margarita TaxID=4874 RepID=A0A8H3XJN2_GIGMA|nr:WD40 repeat-like protein [Gigaspora margarita]
MEILNNNHKQTYQVLSLAHLQNLKKAKEFYDNSQTITALDFDCSGEFCVTASTDETINLYNCLTGRHESFSVSKKYGVHLTRFTHSSSEIVYASTKGNDTLRYLSLRDNQFIRYFRGHQSRVVALEMSPVDDQFLTGSIDEGVRLWDLRQPNSIDFIDIQSGRPCLGYDPSGLVFAIGKRSNKTVQLYDSRKFGQSPFDTFQIDDKYVDSSGLSSPPPEWTGLKFSNDGQKILITTSGDVHYLVDAFNGQLKQRLIGHVGLDNASACLGGEETSFTPDGQYVISGSRDGFVVIWDTTKSIDSSNTPSENIDLRPIYTLNHHVRPTQVTRFNPTKLLMISACTDLVFWLPSVDPNDIVKESEDNKPCLSSGDTVNETSSIQMQVTASTSSSVSNSLLGPVHYHLY